MPKISHQRSREAEDSGPKVAFTKASLIVYKIRQTNFSSKFTDIYFWNIVSLKDTKTR